MREEQMDFSTTERQLLYDIRSEMRKTNELLAQQLEALCAIAKHTEPKVVEKKEAKPKPKPKTEKPKRGKKDAKN